MRKMDGRKKLLPRTCVHHWERTTKQKIAYMMYYILHYIICACIYVFTYILEDTDKWWYIYSTRIRIMQLFIFQKIYKLIRKLMSDPCLLSQISWFRIPKVLKTFIVITLQKTELCWKSIVIKSQKNFNLQRVYAVRTTVWDTRYLCIYALTHCEYVPYGTA